MISVIIPAWNEQEYLSLCLEHLMHQDRRADEIIVVDNNSVDWTRDIASRYPVRVIREKQQGICFARNAGFDAAKGDIVARTDADTRPPSDWIKRIARNFQESDIDALAGIAYFYDFPIGTEKSSFPRMYMRGMKMLHGGKETLFGPNLAVSKEMWRKVRDELIMDDRKVHEDVDLAIKIHKAGGRIFFDEELVMPFSSRRLRKKPVSFFGEYPVRMVKTLMANRKEKKK